MPKLTAAEKQKKYRDKIKNENPQKYYEIQRKARERSARYYEKKKNSYTEEQKQELREKWKEDRNATNAKYACMSITQSSNSKQDIICRRMQSRVEYRLKQENVQLRSQLNTLTKGFKALQKKMIRQKKRIDKMQEDYDNIFIKLNTEKETENKTTQELEEKTPRKRITEFINNNLPNIKTPKKEEIKKKLLEHDILTESLKSQFKTANNAEKNVLKRILDNNIVKKYKLKTNIRTSLGFKSNFKNYRQHKTKTTELQKKIECFYNRDDVSRATAGKKEYRTFKKVTRQKRYLLDKLSVLHRKFIVEEAQISFSTFKKYRPFYVLSPKIKDCESCACKKHSNMQFLVDELKSLNILQTDNLNEVTSNLVCDFYSKDCMYNNCNTCSELKLKIDNEKLLTNSFSLSTSASWFTWVLKEHEYEKAGEKKTMKKMIKLKKEGTIKDLIKIFNEEMKKFKTHVFNFYFQYKQYKECINNLQDDEACIHIDFSENFTCKYHREIQAMHFIKEQITLHTGVVYIKGEKKPMSFCSISPDNQHNPEAIWAHLDPILKYIKNNYSKICTIHFFSDGPTTQYRQKKNFYLFSQKVYEYGYNYGTWSFFEAAHGKGAADGIGGVIKRTLDTKIAQGKDIPNAETAFDILKSEDTSIKIFYIPSHDIKPIQAKLSPLPQTMKIHQLITIEQLKLKNRELSCFCVAPRGSCECHSPVFHSFCPTINEFQANNRRRKIRQRRVSSSTEEDDDDIIEYAESDATAFLSDDSMGLDFNESNLITELDEKTGVLKPKTDPNKKVILLSTIILKKPDDKSNAKKEKPKLLSENEELVQKRFCEATKNIIDKKIVTNLPQIRNMPENTASYDLRESNVFVKESISSTYRGPLLDIDLSQVAPQQPVKEDTMNEIENKNSDIQSNIGEKDENKENKNYTKGEIDTTLQEKIKKERKDIINIECRKENECKKILNVSEKDVRKQALENKDSDEIETGHEKDHESMRGQKSIGEKDIKEAVKWKAIGQTELEDKNNTDNNENLDEQGRRAIESEENKQNDFILNDSVLVKYFQRKTWKYFVGFVENIEFKDGENYYKVKFLKTVKDSCNSAKFVVQRKLDIDIVTIISIVKKVNLIQRESSKEYYLSNDFDMVYFT